ncbi:MAG: hypothetical protein IJ760_01200 [Bacteroidales bacterium]|nr:hypothetical protein [Bacteroidales bacterium]
MDYHKREEELFERWSQRARKLRESEDITKDGLLYRGELWFDGYQQVHRPANEESLWDDASMRLLVLSKELYDEDGWDIRAESGRVPSPRLTCRTAYRFFPNLERWVYGLMNTPDRKVTPFSRLGSETKLQGFYENAPLARVNCKKQPGTHAASNTVLQKYMENYADLLAGQIAMYEADIILCLGGQGVLVTFLRKHVYNDLQEVSPRIYYSPSAGVVAVRQYHPCYSVYSPAEMYQPMAAEYQAFLKEHPEFPHQR